MRHLSKRSTNLGKNVRKKIMKKRWSKSKKIFLSYYKTDVIFVCYYAEYIFAFVSMEQGFIKL